MILVQARENLNISKELRTNGGIKSFTGSTSEPPTIRLVLSTPHLQAKKDFCNCQRYLVLEEKHTRNGTFYQQKMENSIFWKLKSG